LSNLYLALQDVKNVSCEPPGICHLV
jgi:hypothetical protein